MKKLVPVLTSLFLAITGQSETIAVAGHDTIIVNSIQAAAQNSESAAHKQPAVRYRLIEGSTLTDDCTICGRPTIQVPIRGSCWLKPTEHNPLFSNYVVRGLRFRSTAPHFSYAGQMEGTYRIGGEFALLEQMKLDGSINEVKDLKFDSGLVVPQARFPWIEIDLPQVFPNPNDSIFYFRLHLVAVPWPAMWFSTEHGFHPSNQVSAKYSYISDGDLLSSTGTVVRTNHQLTRRLGIMPIVPDLGLDAVLGRMPLASSKIGPARGEIWFSPEDDAFRKRIFSSRKDVFHQTYTMHGISAVRFRNRHTSGFQNCRENVKVHNHLV